MTKSVRILSVAITPGKVHQTDNCGSKWRNFNQNGGPNGAYRNFSLCCTPHRVRQWHFFILFGIRFPIHLDPLYQYRYLARSGRKSTAWHNPLSKLDFLLPVLCFYAWLLESQIKSFTYPSDHTCLLCLLYRMPDSQGWSTRILLPNIRQARKLALHWRFPVGNYFSIHFTI